MVVPTDFGSELQAQIRLQLDELFQPSVSQEPPHSRAVVSQDDEILIEVLVANLHVLRSEELSDGRKQSRSTNLERQPVLVGKRGPHSRVGRAVVTVNFHTCV